MGGKHACRIVRDTHEPGHRIGRAACSVKYDVVADDEIEVHEFVLHIGPRVFGTCSTCFGQSVEAAHIVAQCEYLPSWIDSTRERVVRLRRATIEDSHCRVKQHEESTISGHGYDIIRARALHCAAIIACVACIVRIVLPRHLNRIQFPTADATNVRIQVCQRASVKLAIYEAYFST